MGRGCHMGGMGNAVAEVNSAGVEGGDHRPVPGMCNGSRI